MTLLRGTGAVPPAGVRDAGRARPAGRPAPPAGPPRAVCRPGRAAQGSPADDQEAAAALGNEISHHRQLRALEKVALDVGDDEGVVRVQILAARRETPGQGRGTRGGGLHEERVLPIAVLSLAADRVELQARVGRPRALHEAVLEPRRALDDQDPALAAGRIDEHTP